MTGMKTEDGEKVELPVKEAFGTYDGNKEKAETKGELPEDLAQLDRPALSNLPVLDRNSRP